MELHFREIKITLALDVLRCLTPAMIEKELLLHIIAYNLIHSLMQRAAILHCVELPRLSFKGTLDTLRHFADAVHASEGKPRKQAALLDSMLEIIAADHVPYRPIVTNHAPKNHHHLTKPGIRCASPPMKPSLIFVTLHHWRTPAALTAQSGIPRGMPLCCSNRTPLFPKGRRSRMNNKPKFSNEAGASGVNFTQPSRSDKRRRERTLWKKPRRRSAIFAPSISRKRSHGKTIEITILTQILM